MAVLESVLFGAVLEPICLLFCFSKAVFSSSLILCAHTNTRGISSTIFLRPIPLFTLVRAQTSANDGRPISPRHRRTSRAALTSE